jgi:hypothetical protein
MNCEEAEKQLAEFLDKSLGVQSTKDLDGHLRGCPRCSAELASLTEFQRLVNDLPALEPPAGFTARVMAQVQAAAQRSAIWERLFLPAQLKIALQATAVVLIGILSIYVYEKNTNDQSRLWPIPGNHLSAPPEEEIKTEMMIEKPGSAAEKKYAGTSGSKLPRSTQEMAKPGPGRPNSPRPADDPAAATTPTAGVKDSLLHDKKEEFTSKPKASSGSATPLSIDSLREATGAAANKALSSQARSAPDYELVIRLRSTESRIQAPSGRADALRKREENDPGSQTRQGGIVAQTPAPPSSDSITEVIWYTVPRSRYEEFKNELAVQGSIELETSIGAKEKAATSKSEDNLSIKVTVLPPR